MPGKNYLYAYKNIRNELEGIRNTLRHMQHHKISLTTELQELRTFELNEVMDQGTFQSLSNLHSLFNDTLQNLPNDPAYSLLKLRIKRLYEPDLQNFIKDIKGDFIPDIEGEKGVETEETPQIVHLREHGKYGEITRYYQVIDNELHPCHIDRYGHVTLLNEDFSLMGDADI